MALQILFDVRNARAPRGGLIGLFEGRDSGTALIHVADEVGRRKRYSGTC